METNFNWWNSKQNSVIWEDSAIENDCILQKQSGHLKLE